MFVHQIFYNVIFFLHENHILLGFSFFQSQDFFFFYEVLSCRLDTFTPI